jgi:hypothetical protein
MSSRKLSITKMKKLKTIFYLFTLSLIVVSCNKNDPKLIDENLTELTKLSYLSGITKIELKGNNENYDVEVFKFSKNRSINIKSKNQDLILKTDLNASIKKNKGSNFLIYNFKDKSYNLNNDEVFDKLSKIEKEELIFLITIYNELFDKSIKRYSRLELEEKGIDLK